MCCHRLSVIVAASAPFQQWGRKVLPLRLSAGRSCHCRASRQKALSLFGMNNNPKHFTCQLLEEVHTKSSVRHLATKSCHSPVSSKVLPLLCEAAGSRPYEYEIAWRGCPRRISNPSHLTCVLLMEIKNQMSSGPTAASMRAHVRVHATRGASAGAHATGTRTQALKHVCTHARTQHAQHASLMQVCSEFIMG